MSGVGDPLTVYEKVSDAGSLVTLRFDIGPKFFIDMAEIVSAGSE